ncbi:MAG: hypothetical protein AAGC85_00710 [Bacteroidota bacterium]
MSLVPGHQKISLIQFITRQVDLYQALDQTKHKFGATSVRRASGF